MQATLSGTTLRATLSRIFHSTGAFLAVVLMLAMAPALRGQAVTATLTGTVTDPKGAVLPNATVTIVDENTGSPRSTETTKDGAFSVPNLIPSTYTVKVVAQGFSPKELTGIELHTGDAIRLPVFTLAIGATTDTVTVTSVAGQILETENGQRTATLDYKDIQDIALQSRDTTELLKVLPGVVQLSSGGTGNNGGSSGYNALSTTTGNSAIGTGMGVNGAPSKGGTSLNMDGANVLDVGDDFASLATVNPEMTQEVQVQTSNFGADEANGPVVVNTTGKSGGEHYHGQAYFDVRNDVLNANDWQDNHRTPVSPKNGAHYYYPGGSFSGPVPHTNKKLFFFGGVEFLNQFQGNANQLNFTEMTPAMLKGDFSMDDPDNAILCPGGFYGSGTTVNTTNNVGIDGNGLGVNSGSGIKYGESSWCQNITMDQGNTNYTIFPDGSTVAGGGPAVVTNYAGNANPVVNSYGGKMPSQWVDKNMVAFAQNWPGWNSGAIIKNLNAIIQNGGSNVHMPISNSDNGWLARGRIDYNWNSTNQFYISYQQSYDSQLSGGCGTGLYSGCNGSNIQFPGGGTTTRTYSKVVNGHYVHIFSPTLTNEALASWVWGNIPHVPNNPTADYRSTLGASFGCFYCQVGTRFMPTYGGGQGYPGIGVGDVWEPGNYYIVQKAIPTFADNLTKVWGRHTLKFGATTSNTDNYQGSQNGAGEQGSFSFGGSAFGNTPNFNFFAAQASAPGGGCTACNGYTGHVGSGNPTTNFLMGDLTNYQETNSEPLTDLAFQSVGIYGMDTVKVSKKLSLNVGFRFEHIGAWYDRQGIGLAVFNAADLLPDFYAGRYAPGFRWHAADAGVPLSGKPDRIGFISPRFGLSYDVFGNGRTTVRGGWGAYRYQEATNAPQNALTTAQGATTFQGTSVLGTLQNSTMLASQIGQLKPFAPICQKECAQPSGQTGFDPHDYGIPLTYAYNFTIDQKLPWNMMFDVGYVGNHAKRLQDTFAGNGDGSGIGNYDNQNKTPLGAYGQTVGIGTGSQYVPNPLGDPFTHRLVCNPENLAAPCNVAGTASTDADFRPYGRGVACTNPNNPTCTIYGTQSITMIQHNAYQNYNALQATLLKRAGPITLNLNATWSKSLGIESNLDPFHISTNNSYDNEQRPWVFNTNYIYREPNFWHGNRFVGGAVNGWTISGITLWQEGTNVGPGMNINYDPTTLPSVTGQTVTLAGQTYTATQLGLTSTSTGVGASTFFGTNAGISTSRPDVTCNPKSGLATYQLYRPCFTASPFGQSGGLHLPFVAGQAYFENDLAIYKTFTVHEQNKVQFRLTATNWLNHPTPGFNNTNESTTEYYLYDYNTHALKPNDRCSGTATGSCNPGLPYLATTTFATPGQKASDLFGQQHFKNGFGAFNQRILELNVKYLF
jgi:hypothetical protein